MLLIYIMLLAMIPAIAVAVGTIVMPALRSTDDTPADARARDSVARRMNNREAADNNRFEDIEFSREIRGYPTVEVDALIADYAAGITPASEPVWQPRRGGYHMAEVDDLVLYLRGDAPELGMANSSDVADTTPSDEVFPATGSQSSSVKEQSMETPVTTS